LTQLSGYLAAAGLVVLFLLVCLEVGTRTFLGSSFQFTWEYAGYLVGAVTFLAAAPALDHGTHVRISILLDGLSPRGSRMLDAFATLVAIALVAFLLFALGGMTWQSWQNGTVSSTVNATPLIVPQAVMLFGTVVFEIQLVARLARIGWGYLPDSATPSVLEQD